jgi:eukaryotic-like serine/threonine-protein kinase
LLRFLRWLSISLVLLLVFLAAALFAMRFAIHGREVRVPRLTNLTPAEAERVANADGLITFIDSRYYSSEVPKGRIVFQVPPANANVRRGWKIQLAESLGPQHAAVPDLVGQSEHAAAVNLHRHGLEIGNVATVRLPQSPPATVIAQSPSADAKEVASPRIALAISAADNAEQYVMPSFVGTPAQESADILEKAGFKVGNSPAARKQPIASPKDNIPLTGVVVKQYPAAGQKIEAGGTVYFEIRK